MITGTPKFHGLAVGEFTCNVMGVNVALKAKAAFVDPATGTTHGWTEATNGWSPATMLKMREFVAAMEEDIAAVHFTGLASSPNNAPTAGAPGLSGGLSEHVGTADGDQV